MKGEGANAFTGESLCQINTTGFYSISVSSCHARHPASVCLFQVNLANCSIRARSQTRPAKLGWKGRLRVQYVDPYSPLPIIPITFPPAHVCVVGVRLIVNRPRLPVLNRKKSHWVIPNRLLPSTQRSSIMK